MVASTNDKIERPKRFRRTGDSRLIKARTGGFIGGVNVSSPLQTGGCCGEPLGALTGSAIASCCGEASAGGANTAGGCCGEPTLAASGQPHVASQGCCGETADNCCG